MVQPGPLPPDAGGDPACWASQVCPECGAFRADGYHRRGCPTGEGRTPPRDDDGRAATIEAVKADITGLAVDAVVNAANPALAMGGGVDGAIHRAAGVLDLAAACAALGGCATGDAKATPGFALPARWVIHTVGPVWHGGGHGEAELLASCYRRSVEVADELGARSMAFPAISTGVYGFPGDLAAEIAVGTLRGLPTSVERVHLVAFDEHTLDRYERLLTNPGAR